MMTPGQPRSVSREDLPQAIATLIGQGFRLALVCGLQGDDGLRVVHALARPGDDARVEVAVEVPVDDPWVPSLAPISFPAGRFEREVRDLFGIVPRGHPLPRRLVRHAHWPSGWYPMRREARTVPAFAPDTGAFPFLEVAGQGVYEVPVGPVHAGLIEPGHFRFSVLGETIIRMKARLWYVHRGLERLFEGRTPQAGVALAERVSGDTAVGHALGYVMAVEQALGLDVSTVDAQARALLLELERLYNHVADIGAILNDVAFGIAHVHAQRLREDLLRLNARVTGHRLLRGAVHVGGTALVGLPDLDVIRTCAARTAEIVALALDHPIVLDRLATTAVLHLPDAERLGTLGYVARASGLDLDARRDHPFTDLGPHFRVVTEPGGDVLARLKVRAGEVAVSARVIAWLVERLVDEHAAGRLAHRPGGPPGGRPSDRSTASTRGGPGDGPPSGTGSALVEGWRGTICHRVELGAGGTLSRVKVVDPSFFNWPALPVALANTIVPDFPLANKSFNQSYAGNDL